MATEREIELVCDIQRLSIQVNMQGKYHAFCEYYGHVNCIDVRLIHAPYGEKLGDSVDGWHSYDRNVYLSTNYRLSEGEDMADVIEYKIELLEKLKSDLSGMLSTDSDGIPL